MDVEERWEICSTCLNRGFNPDEGWICSLTGKSAEFEDECLDYAVDEDVMNSPEPVKVSDKSAITGWLGVFLYIVVAGGTIWSVSNVITALTAYGVRLSTAAKIVIVASAVLVSIVAIATIVTFNRRKSNAVSWARTYLLFLLLDDISVLCVTLMTGGWSDYYFSIWLSFLWPVIWLLYLNVSRRVRTVIPPETRTWGSFEKQLLFLFVITKILYVYVFSDFDIMYDAGKYVPIMNEIDFNNRTLFIDTVPDGNNDYRVVY